MKSGRSLIDVAKHKQSNRYNIEIKHFVDYLSDEKIDSNTRVNLLKEVLYGIEPSNVDIDFVSMLFKELMSMDLYKRDQCDLISIKGACVLECTGSGKKSIKTLNISTPSILLAVAAGAYIIKKGSHATSSLLGSADILSMVGYKSPNTIEEQKRQLIDTGFSFVNIEHVIPKFNSIYSGYYYKPHILSYVLGAYVTSLRGNKLVYGVSCPECDYSAKLLNMLVPDAASTYCSSENGTDYFDELVGNMQIVCHIKKGNIDKELFEHKLPITDEVLQPMSKQVAIKEFLQLLRGMGNSSYENIILHNSAFFLIESGVVDNWTDGLELSRETLTKGKAFLKLEEIVKNSGGKFVAKL